jgi:sterol desaturase/sphingolipid hydroxylase (fatty acid hydroxylase superfamily)
MRTFLRPSLSSRAGHDLSDRCRGVFLATRPSADLSCLRPRITVWSQTKLMTAILYFGEMLVASLLAIVLLAISPLGITSAGRFIAGAVVWTFAEYVSHRFVLHQLAPREHALHHASPDEPVGKIFWQIWVAFALVYGIVGGSFLAGALVAYAWYLFVHYCAHLGSDHVPSSLLKHHQKHHRLASRNYGVSTTLWDRVFGTMLR